MVNYRRNRVAGGTYFFTVASQDRRSDLLVREIDALKQAWRNAAQRVPHLVLAAAVLPEHLHAVIQMDASTDNYPRLWQEIKKGFTRRENRGQSGVSAMTLSASGGTDRRMPVLVPWIIRKQDPRYRAISIFRL